MSVFSNTLDGMLSSSFGYAEVELIIRDRALECVDLASMEPLEQPIDSEWRNGRCQMSAEEVVEKLKELGIWQFVRREVELQKMRKRE